MLRFILIRYIIVETKVNKGRKNERSKKETVINWLYRDRA